MPLCAVSDVRFCRESLVPMSERRRRAVHGRLYMVARLQQGERTRHVRTTDVLRALEEALTARLDTLSRG